MKIVFVSGLYLPHLGGVEIHLREVSAVLVRMGHSVTIVTAQYDQKLQRVTRQNGIQVIRLPIVDAENKQAVWSEIQKQRSLFLEADVVHVHDVFWWILPVYFQIRKKVFITFHGWETQFPIPINTKIHRFLAAVLSQKTIHIGSFIQKFYWDKPDAVSYGGINPKRFTKSNKAMLEKTKKETQKSDTHIQFVFIGRLEKDTDVLLYLNFLEELQTKKTGFKMVWVGDGSLRSECEKIGIVTGFVKNVSQYILQADFVFATSYLAILEAQSLQKIVLSFYSNPLKKEYLESFPGSNYMLVAGSVEKMLKKLEHVCSSRKLLYDMQTKAQKFALSNTWNTVTETYLQLWKKGKRP